MRNLIPKALLEQRALQGVVMSNRRFLLRLFDGDFRWATCARRDILSFHLRLFKGDLVFAHLSLVFFRALTNKIRQPFPAIAALLGLRHDCFTAIRAFLCFVHDIESVRLLFPPLPIPRINFLTQLHHFLCQRQHVVLIIAVNTLVVLTRRLWTFHGLVKHGNELVAQQISMTRKDLTEAYMILGGIPYYWSLLRRNESLTKNIDRLFFSDNSRLGDEFEALYASLFKRPASYINIVTALATKKAGMTRKELLESTGLDDNSVFVHALKELEQCNFIRKYQIIGKKQRDAIYQLMDNFTLFYFRYLSNNTAGDNHFWTNNLPTQLHATWAGLAFERVCLWHLPQIKNALGIAGVISSAQSWHTEATDEHDGAQIDLLIDRNDGVINLCEMKFSDDVYSIDNEEDSKLRRRKSVFKQVTQTRKAIHTTMITTYGVAHNAYWNNIQSEVDLKDLFKE